MKFMFGSKKEMQSEQQLDGSSIKILLELSFRGITLMLKLMLWGTSLLYSAPVQHSSNDNQNEKRKARPVLKTNNGQGRKSVRHAK